MHEQVMRDEWTRISQTSRSAFACLQENAVALRDACMLPRCGVLHGGMMNR